jgi:hypothetical protein
MSALIKSERIVILLGLDRLTDGEKMEYIDARLEVYDADIDPILLQQANEKNRIYSRPALEAGGLRDSVISLCRDHRNHYRSRRTSALPHQDQPGEYDPTPADHQVIYENDRW